MNILIPPKKPIATGRDYALFVPLMDTEQGLSLLYQRRSPQMRRQPGDICFPGGKVDPGESILEASLRELWEELAVKPQEVYGETDFLCLRSGDVVYPVLGKVSPPFAPNPTEVAEVFSVPVAELLAQKEEYTLLLEPKPQFTKENVGRTTDYPFQTGREEVPVYRYEDKVIWGMTGRITKSILRYL